MCIPNPEEQLAPADCKGVLHNGKTLSGKYLLQLGYKQFLNVYCDMTTDGGGWTVFQRRKDGFVKFYLNWANYEAGFGSLTGDFWLGNKWLHLLTSLGPTELRIDFNGGQYVKYRLFSVDNAVNKYRLSVSGYSGNERNGDKLSSNNNMKFSTFDQDNDRANKNCAEAWFGGWWFNGCGASNLNGIYGKFERRGIYWGKYHSRKTFTEMKLRRL